MSWKDYLVPASFRGISFHVEVGGRAGGKRLVPHEFPKKNIGYTEDMGRRLKRFTVAAYLIGDNFIFFRNILIQALEAEGAGFLSLPTGFNGMVLCEGFNVQERRELGGMAEIEMAFFEAGQAPSSFGVVDTPFNIETQSLNASNIVSSLLNSTLSSR